MRTEVLCYAVTIIATNLTWTACETVPLAFELANIAIELQQVMADQFLKCLCNDPSSDCRMYGERLGDFKTYRILSVHHVGSTDQGPADVRNCMSLFGKADIVITCNKVTAHIYNSNPHMRDRCQALKHTEGGRCRHYSGIMWNLVDFQIRKNDSVFETLTCKSAFSQFALTSLTSSTEILEKAIIVTSITLGFLLLLMFIVVQYMKPKRPQDFGSDL